MPPFLLCKDNTFLSEMQIWIFGADVGRGAVMAKNCDKVGWGIWSERRWFAPHYNAHLRGITDSVTACVAIILTTIPPLSTAVLLKQLRPRQKLLHARLAKLFEALSGLLHGAFALGVAFRVELVGVTHHLLLHRFG